MTFFLLMFTSAKTVCFFMSDQIKLQSILLCFYQMHLGDRLRVRQIRNCSALFQHPVVSSHCQLQLPHSGLHQRMARIIQPAVLTNMSRAHVSIAGDICAFIALPLAFPCSHYTSLHFLRRFSFAHSSSIWYSSLDICMRLLIQSI